MNRGMKREDTVKQRGGRKYSKKAEKEKDDKCQSKRQETTLGMTSNTNTAWVCQFNWRENTILVNCDNLAKTR